MTAGIEQAFEKNPRREPVIQSTRTEEKNYGITNKNSDQLLLSYKFVTHQPKSGLNPLVDAAAYLFSIIGKLKKLKSYRHLSKLQKELIQEMNNFQDATKTRGYSSEYILVSRFALCATIDDVIANTFWGGQGQWDNYNMLAVFNQDAMNHERFFVILERIIKDPAQYIDVMELMYVCLSLGFKGHYRTTEFGSAQLEQITHSLYRRIRNHRGEIIKSLAPYPMKTPKASKPLLHIPLWLILLATSGVIFVIFMSLGYMLDSISNQAYQELMRIGNSLLYETTHS